MRIGACGDPSLHVIDSANTCERARDHEGELDDARTCAIRPRIEEELSHIAPFAWVKARKRGDKKVSVLLRI